MMTKGRLEAFSDGIIAIAATLLVLNLKVPPAGSHSLGHELGEQWPSYAAYVTSFLTIGIIWTNHHSTMERLRLVDQSVLILNLMLLMCVGVLPWTTALFAEYLRHGSGQSLAGAIYAGSFLLMSIAFYALQRHTLFARDHLLHEQSKQLDRVGIARRSRRGLLPYAIAMGVAPLSADVTLGICAALAIYYAVPAPTLAAQALQ